MAKIQISGSSGWAYKLEVAYDQISRVNFAAAIINAQSPGSDQDPQPVMRSRNKHIMRSEVDAAALVMFLRPLFDLEMSKKGTIFYKRLLREAVEQLEQNGAEAGNAQVLLLKEFEQKCTRVWKAPSAWVKGKTNQNVWNDIVYAYYFHENQQYETAYKNRLVTRSFVPQLTERYMDPFALINITNQLEELAEELGQLLEDAFEIVE